MAIVREKIGEFFHTYSDAGLKIHGGFPEGDYDEAYDTTEIEYTETEKKVVYPKKDESYYAEAGRILLGEVEE